MALSPWGRWQRIAALRLVVELDNARIAGQDGRAPDLGAHVGLSLMHDSGYA